MTVPSKLKNQYEDGSYATTKGTTSTINTGLDNSSGTYFLYIRDNANPAYQVHIMSVLGVEIYHGNNAIGNVTSVDENGVITFNEQYTGTATVTFITFT